MNEKLKWIVKPIYFELQRLLMIIPDDTYLRIRYRIRVGKKLNLNNPVSYNEKLQWLKLHDDNPEYTRFADKCEVKKIVSDLIGDDYIIPTLGVWDKFDDIDFDELPEKFVLKCTHDSGSVVICNDRSSFDYRTARRKINAEMSRNFYWLGREKQYRDIPRRIIAEPYIADSNELKDYKFFVFNGVVKAMYVASERSIGKTKFDFFDTDFNHLDFVNGHPNSQNPIQKPQNFERMKELAEVLGKDFRHVRIDFYETDNKIWFGEYTFYHMDGMARFVPEEWDYRFGEWLDIDQI